MRWQAYCLVRVVAQNSADVFSPDWRPHNCTSDWVQKEMSRMKYSLIVAAAALMALSAGARADIVMDQNPGNFPADENILFNQPNLPSTGNLVQGVTNQTAFIVDFNSTTSLLANGGQARVEGQTVDYQDLSISLADSLASFTTLILNINASGAGTVNITATEDNGTP